MAKHKWDLRCEPPRQLVHPVRIDPSGVHGPTRATAYGPRWRSTSQGLYVPADTPTDVVEQRIAEQAARLPAGGAVTGWAACRLYQANFFDGLAHDGHTRLPVPLALGQRGNLRRDPAIRLDHSLLAPEEVVVRFGVPVTGRERAVFDAMRWAPSVREAVVVLEMAVGAGVTSVERMSVYAEAHAGWEGIVQVRAAVALAREHALSPQEVRMRLRWELDAGLPPPHVNCPVHDRAGRLLGIADLLDEEAGLAAEFDGAEHRDGVRHTKDLAKDDAFRRAGIELVRFTGADLRNEVLFVDRLLAARSRARFEPADQRRWVARPLPDCAEQRLRESELIAALENVRGPFPAA